MSRPRFLADNDLKDQIVRGVIRRAPAIEFVRPRDLGLESHPDDQVLDFAAKEGFIIVSHDVNTMTAEAYNRTGRGQAMHGLLLAHQSGDVRSVIEDLVLIWMASEAEEWIDQVQYLPF